MNREKKRFTKDVKLNDLLVFRFEIGRKRETEQAVVLRMKSWRGSRKADLYEWDKKLEWKGGRARTSHKCGEAKGSRYTT
jgi:hypothetical protein